MNSACSVILQLPEPADRLPARLLHTTYVTMPMRDVPDDVFDDGRDRSIDYAVIAIAHVPRDAVSLRGDVSEREDHLFPPAGWR
ncbi:hypothetical protein CDO52_13090 [Nocardiopsis gilva YIM 90087]|uniref:Uncharacterized protein n=1 Tax=Nocardiopsis gilva YIM 90087 TaxID=1235441 RepID=A0A223S619_9ACTN|nr:hypothetical protein [Nocardiopsis gilva]ASU83603.1 hypothetical protein CDO52_13090 [Nocardiopsis gilva YIM 90087]